MSELVDRVALTIAQHFRDPKTPMSEAQAVALFSSVARKVIAAMHDPTEAMLESYRQMMWSLDDTWRGAAKEIWNGMLDAAWGEKE